MVVLFSDCLLHISLLLCSFRWKWVSEPCLSAPWCPCPAVPTGSTSRDSTALASSMVCKVRSWGGKGQGRNQITTLLNHFSIHPSHWKMFCLCHLQLLSGWWGGGYSHLKMDNFAEGCHQEVLFLRFVGEGSFIWQVFWLFFQDRQLPKSFNGTRFFAKPITIWVAASC